MAYPTESDIRTAWKAAVNILEKVRDFSDATVALPSTGLLDVLTASLKGQYLPNELQAFGASMRAGLSNLISPNMATTVITPILFEYANVISQTATTTYQTVGQGNGYQNGAELFRVLYEWMARAGTPITIQSRVITFDTTFDTYGLGGSNAIIGNGTISRLTVDAYDYPMEACHVEQKTIRCRADQSTGTEKWAEVFEINGTQASFDNLLRKSYGSGESNRTTIVAKHAGTGSGGSLLTNSSFSEYSATASPKFTGWTETAGGSALSQDTTTVYRSHPGGQTTASMKLTGTGSTITVTQPLTSMRIRRIDANTPYFCRIMVRTNTADQATSGNIVLTMGSVSTTVAVSGLSADTWTEVRIGSSTAKHSWPQNFNTDTMSVKIEWTTSQSGKILYIDDAILCPWDLVDGTYWCLRQTANAPVAHRVDDVFICTDTQADATKGKLQYWNWVSGYGYLPSAASTPTISDPT